MLALDSILGAASAAEFYLGDSLQWYRWRFFVLAFTPGAWLYADRDGIVVADRKLAGD